MNRLSDSARVAITFKPLRVSSRQSGGGGSRRSRVSRLPAIDLMGASELFISWPSTLTSRCQALRSSSRRVRLRSVQNEQFMREPTLAEVALAHAPAAAPTGKCQGERRVFIGVEANRQTEITRPAAEQFVDRLAKQILACTINQTESSIRIEGEDRDFDPGHDRAEQRRCLEGSQPLHAQRLAELIDLEQDFAERVSRPARRGHGWSNRPRARPRASYS